MEQEVACSATEHNEVTQDLAKGQPLTDVDKRLSEICTSLHLCTSQVSADPSCDVVCYREWHLIDKDKRAFCNCLQFCTCSFAPSQQM